MEAVDQIQEGHHQEIHDLERSCQDQRFLEERLEVEKTYTGRQWDLAVGIQTLVGADLWSDQTDHPDTEESPYFRNQCCTADAHREVVLDVLGVVA